MYPFFVALHVLLCLFLMLIIMLQPGKGGDISAAFGGGGGGSTMFGPRGPTGLLQRATTMVAVLFMGTTLTLALYSHRGVMDSANVDEHRQRIEEQERQRRSNAAPSDAAPAPSEGAPAGEAPSEELVAPLEVPPPAGAP